VKEQQKQLCIILAKEVLLYIRGTFIAVFENQGLCTFNSARWDGNIVLPFPSRTLMS
jgi:hypothetical protein